MVEIVLLSAGHIRPRMLMQRAMGPHACPFLFFYFLLREAGNEGKATPPQGDPRVPTPLPAAPAPTCYPSTNPTGVSRGAGGRRLRYRAAVLVC